MKQLPVYAKLCSEPAVGLPISIFGISDYGMAKVGKMGPYLMGASGIEPNSYETQPFSAMHDGPYGIVARLYMYGSRLLMIKYGHPVIPFILPESGAEPHRAHVASDHRKIILFACPVMEET